MRASYIAIVSLVGAIGLVIGSAFSAAVAFGAIGLFVQGTGTPNANIVADYMKNARDRYMQGTACNDVGNCGSPLEVGPQNATLNGINYPASFWPLAFIPNWCRSGPDGCDKWDESVGKGTASLQAQLETALTTTDEPIVLFGYSQGGAVVSNVLNNYIKNLSGPDAEALKERIQIVTIGGIETPDGGLWSRLSFLRYLPIFDITFGPAMTPDPSVKQTVLSFHFDPVGDAPRYWGNPFALLNAVAALETVHGYYLAPNGNGPDETLPYGYTTQTLPAAIACNVGVNCRKDANGNEYIVVKATSLPIADFIYGAVPAALRPVIKPLLELVAPAYRVLAELGYDYSGDPSVSTPLSILPFNPFTFNPVNFALQFAGAIGQGIQNALGGGTSLSPLNPPAATVTTNAPAVQALSRLASDSSATSLAAPAVVDPVETAPVVAEKAPVVEAAPLASVTELPVTPKVTTPSTDVVEKTESTTTAAIPAKESTVGEKVEPTTGETKAEVKDVEKAETTKDLDKTESAKAETKTEPAKTEPAKAETKTEPAKTETKTEAKADEKKDADTKAAA